LDFPALYSQRKNKKYQTVSKYGEKEHIGMGHQITASRSGGSILFLETSKARPNSGWGFGGGRIPKEEGGEKESGRIQASARKFK